MPHRLSNLNRHGFKQYFATVDSKKVVQGTSNVELFLGAFLCLCSSGSSFCSMIWVPNGPFEATRLRKDALKPYFRGACATVLGLRPATRASPVSGKGRQALPQPTADRDKGSLPNVNSNKSTWPALCGLRRVQDYQQNHHEACRFGCQPTDTIPSAGSFRCIQSACISATTPLWVGGRLLREHKNPKNDHQLIQVSCSHEICSPQEFSSPGSTPSRSCAERKAEAR